MMDLKFGRPGIGSATGAATGAGAAGKVVGRVVTLAGCAVPERAVSDRALPNITAAVTATSTSGTW